MIPPEIASWIPLIGWLILGGWALYKYIRKGRKADRDERASEIDKSTATSRAIASDAEKLAVIRGEEIRTLEAKILRVEAERDRARDERDALVQSVLRAEADIKELRERQERLERKK